MVTAAIAASHTTFIKQITDIDIDVDWFEKEKLQQGQYKLEYENIMKLPPHEVPDALCKWDPLGFKRFPTKDLEEFWSLDS
jgi:hypothetical protein